MDNDNKKEIPQIIAPDERKPEPEDKNLHPFWD